MRPAAGLAAQAEALTRALVAWPHHLNASSRRTLAQALARCALEVDGGLPPASPIGAAALVVDDDAISRITMTQVLEKAGFTVTAVSEAQAALAAAQQRSFRLVLSDVLMEGMNGLQFAARLRRIDGCRDLPVIFVTALADFDTLFLQGDDPAADSIAKPFLPAELATKALTRMR